MLRVYNETYIKNLSLKLSILLVRSYQSEEVFRSRKSRLWIVYYKTHVMEIVLISLITICSNNRKLRYKFHALTKYILYLYVVWIVVV